MSFFSIEFCLAKLNSPEGKLNTIIYKCVCIYINIYKYIYIINYSTKFIFTKNFQERKFKPYLYHTEHYIYWIQ